MYGSTAMSSLWSQQLAVAVGAPGELAVAYYGSRDGGWTFDGFVSVSSDACSDSPTFRSVQTRAEAAIQPNRLSEPCEYVGVDFAPDGAVWASFARDTRRIDRSSSKYQGDGNFHYNSRRYRGVVVRVSGRVTCRVRTRRSPIRLRPAAS
jgi:hypothetical protein